jgi:hypothetical protein
MTRERGISRGGDDFAVNRVVFVGEKLVSFVFPEWLKGSFPDLRHQRNVRLNFERAK